MYSILVCDDEKDIAAAIKIYLETEGYKVFTAENGREALDIAAKEEIHLIIMDVMMPVMDGIEAVRKLREDSIIPVIMLTAKSEDVDKVLGLGIGADDYVTKPFNPIELIARAKSQIRRYVRFGGQPEKSDDKVLAINGLENAVNGRMKSERFKTELITNVSHDIKTPLTSIINYTDLLKKENIETEPVKGYIEVLDRQSERLKKLITDLLEASKASSGNIKLDIAEVDAGLMLEQVYGEYQNKFEKAGLTGIVTKPSETVFIKADANHLFRVFDNILGNVVKYAQPGTRVYIDLTQNDETITISFKNISKEKLNITGEELMERFVRGDRSRNTEGSGLGLSIAKSLANLMGGELEIVIDGDLFKVEVSSCSATASNEEAAAVLSGT